MNATTGAPIEIPEIADLLRGICCTCMDEAGNDVGAMARELFRRVDLEGQLLEMAADAVALDPRDARAILVVVRRCIADAVVKDIS